MQKYLNGVLATLGVLVIAFLLSMLLVGCASISPRADYSDAELEQDGRCAAVCWLMSVRNDNYFEARVFINGRRVATLPGMMPRSVGIPISRSMLDGTGCMVVVVKLFPDPKAAESTRECPVAGSRLQLAIDDSYGGHALHLWLHDWRRR